VFGDVGEQIADLDPGLAMLLEVRERPARLEHRALQLGELLALGERLRERLLVEFLELRFPVERLEIAMDRPPCRGRCTRFALTGR